MTEALDPAGEEFTDERLVEFVKGQGGSPPQDVLTALLAEVKSFCADATQSDDVTAVMVRFNG